MSFYAILNWFFFERRAKQKKNLHYIIFNMGEFNKGFSRKKICICFADAGSHYL